MASANLLKIDSICKHFGGLNALSSVSFSVERGKLFGLVGPNGSGKTTLFNCITGFLPPDRGRVLLNGEEITRRSPNWIARRGLGRTFQAPLNPQRLTVMENMLLAPQDQVGESMLKSCFAGGTIRRQESQHLERAWELLELVKLERQADTYAGDLSGGQKKLLMLGQVLMLSPKLVLLDEPVAGVNPRLIDEIVDTILGLHQREHNFMIVEHNMSVVRRLCDVVCVMDAGQVIATGPAEETLQREDVLRAYLAKTDSDGDEAWPT